MEKLGDEAGKKGRIGGKAVKTIGGVSDSFHRLRVGDNRVMYEIDEAGVVLVLGIVHRGDLERWIRGR